MDGKSTKPATGSFLQMRGNKKILLHLQKKMRQYFGLSVGNYN